MRDDYLKQALSKIQDPNVLINVVSRRVKQLKRGNRPLVESLEKLAPEDIALREPGWSKHTLQVAYSFSNQFELPVLFYVLTILEWVTRHAGVLFVWLAWIFVIFRLLQAYVHVTNNNVRLRGAFYSVAAVVLMIMWAIYIVQVLIGI